MASASTAVELIIGAFAVFKRRIKTDRFLVCLFGRRRMHVARLKIRIRAQTQRQCQSPDWQQATCHVSVRFDR
jgi:hypothetical protein